MEPTATTPREPRAKLAPCAHALSHALALALAACAAPSGRASAGGPRPALDGLDARVTFTRVGGAPPAVEVAVDSRGASDGNTTFELSESWGGVEHFERSVRAPRAEGSDGRALPVEARGERAWRVAHGPGETIRFRYELVQLGAEVDDTSESYYRPIVLPGLFHSIGFAGIARPGTIDERGRGRFEARFVGFNAAISSHGDGERGRFVGSWIEFVHAVFLAGDVRIHRIPVRGANLAVAIHGKDWTFTDEAFVDLARRVVEAERGFFHDDGDPNYLITAIPVGKPQARGHSLGGTGLTASFALFMRPDTKLEDERGRPSRVKHLLAHELFHNWNGRIIEREEPEELVYWFSEGFTDHFARRLMLRAGLLSPEQFVTDVNDRLAEYAKNPKRTVSNATIQAEFWSDPNVQKVPYERGDLVGFLVDFEMRKRSSVPQSVDDLMLDLFEAARARGEKISTDRLLERIASRTSEEFAAEIRGIVVDGKPIELDPNVLAPMASMTKGSDGAPPRFECKPGARASDWIRGASR